MFAVFFRKLSFGTHLAINFFLRITLILYGDIMDQYSQVPYTDVDYKVISLKLIIRWDS